MTFEERKQAIIANGIVPGALIRCAVDKTCVCIVEPVEEWSQYVDGSVWVGPHFGYDSVKDRYATVITPAAPTELDRLRALEAEVIKVWTEDGGSVQMHTPIAWMRVLRLIPSLNQDEPTNTPDQQ